MMNAERVMVSAVLTAAVCVLLSVDVVAQAAAPPNKPIVFRGRGGGSVQIIETDGTVTEVSKEKMVFRNTAGQRLLEANTKRAQTAAEDEKRRREEAEKLKAAQTDADKKKAEADQAEAEKRAAEEKKNAEEAKKQEEAALRAVDEKSFDYVGAEFLQKPASGGQTDGEAQASAQADTGASPGSNAQGPTTPEPPGGGRAGAGQASGG